jgi:ribosome-associated protein
VPADSADPSEPAPGMLRLAPGVEVAGGSLTFSASRSGGPGGQNVNNTSSKIELRLRLDAIRGLSVRAVDRLAMLSGSRLTAAGELILCCDETRSLRTNKALVVERLCARVVDAQAVPRHRKRTRPGRGAIERRLQAKAENSERKRGRRSAED